MRTPLTALREHRRAVAAKKEREQQHMRYAVALLAAKQWGDVVWAPPTQWKHIESMYWLGRCMVCGDFRIPHHGEQAKHLRINGGVG